MKVIPKIIRPQRATLVDREPVGPYIHEMNRLGCRLLCRRHGKQVGMFTRHGQDWSEKCSGIVESIRQLPGDQFWLDGELVLLPENGGTSFIALRQAMETDDHNHLVYFVFDLLYMNGRELLHVPLEKRKEALAGLTGTGVWNLRYVDSVEGNFGPQLFKLACEAHLDGIVSKKTGSLYCPGERSRDWLRMKC